METISIIINNPYRILGVFTNSSKKEIVANKGKLNAFLKVGKNLEFPLDLKTILPSVQRSINSLAQAESVLSLAKDQLRYVLFWFVNQTQIDDIAFNHLIAGNIDTAISIWEKKISFSSLQNIMLCSLLKGDYQRAFSNANILFEEYLQNYIKLLSNQITISTLDLIHLFIDCLFEEEGINHSIFFNLIDNTTWNDYIKTKLIQPLIDSISKEIEKAGSANRKDSKARYLAGSILKKNTTDSIKRLKKLLPTTDMQYQILIDKLGLEILQCGIDYFNTSEEPDAAIKAMELQTYALTIVVGKVAKERCKENVDILKKIIDELPPMEVFEEDKTIKNELARYTKLSETIANAENLLQKVKPIIEKVKSKLGPNNSYYLKMSTAIVAAALHNLIEEVNDIQNKINSNSSEIDPLDRILGRKYHSSFGYENEEAKRLRILSMFPLLKGTLEEAWRIIKIMDSFDMEYNFKQNRYIPNRNTLKNLCEQVGISTYESYSSKNSSRPPLSKETTISTNSNKSKSNSEPSGCLIAFIAWIVLGCIAGAICVARDGDFSAGFAISGCIVLFFSRLVSD